MNPVLFSLSNAMKLCLTSIVLSVGLIRILRSTKALSAHSGKNSRVLGTNKLLGQLLSMLSNRWTVDAIEKPYTIYKNIIEFLKSVAPVNSRCCSKEVAFCKKH